MKQFFEQYGGVALGILALLVLIAMITPVGNIIKTSLQGTVHTFSSSIEKQHNDALESMTKVQEMAAYGAVIDVPGTIVNYNGQSLFSNTYTEADVIWPANYDFEKNVTVYAEFKNDNTNRTSAVLISNYEYGGVGIYLTDLNEVAFQIFSEAEGQYITLVTSDFDSSQLNKVAGIYDGSTMKLYINGILKKQKNLTGNIRVSTKSIIVGNPASTDGSSYELPQGIEIYRLGVFDGALTLEQIESLQNR